ncbi:MAG TPA: response regulator, partial [Candidatus Acidoferrum sp.]|nr:response regulator [Candidatus Acidoferrum sp.]
EMNGSGAATIFVVDDDRGLVRLIEKSLRREGHITAGATSAAGAIAWLDTNRADLMLLDLKLESAHAHEVIEQLTARGTLIPFIIITGQGDERVAVDMMKRGALDYLVKDANFQEFVPTMVRRALDRIARDRKLVAADEERLRLERQILEIGDRERRRIGQDLHDGLGQHLAGIELMTEALEQKLATKNKTEATRAANIARHVREAIRQTRSLARGLSPVEPDRHGLMSSLQELAANASEMFRVTCRFTCTGHVHIENNVAATHLFRIAQEAVSNAIKHGHAREIQVALSDAPDAVQLTITDNGGGLAEPPPESNGMGLRIMRYRTSVIGGELSVERHERGGTVVRCVIPAKALKEIS